MARSTNEQIVVGLDVGTTKICAIVGRVHEKGVDIVGIGTSPSRGLRKGVVISIDTTVNSIKSAIEEAENMAGCDIQSVYAGIAGSHIRGFNSHGIVAVKKGEVSQADVERVIDAAKAVAIPVDREIFHILPQEFVVDGQDGIKEPLGMSGVRLEANIHIVTGAVTSAQNIVKCAQRCALNVSDIVLEQLASAFSVLNEDEKELGVALVDIGGGTTDLAIFSEGSIQHTSAMAIGGYHLTNDIAVGLSTPPAYAEELKKEFGHAYAQLMNQEETIEVRSIGTREMRTLPRHYIGEILEARVREIFELIAREIERAQLRHLLASGLVLTGGTTLLPGMVELAEEVLDLPVRLGVPRQIGGLTDAVSSPIYSTGVGLVLYGAQNQDHRHFRAREENIYTTVKRRMATWLQDMF
ncbi:MAG: cell division protein FtsA [Myxococcota bacterium]